LNRIAVLLAPAAALLLAACAGAPPAPPPGEPGTVTPRAGGDAASPQTGAAPFATLATEFTARALKQEAAGDLRRALDSWKVVAALRADFSEAKRRVADLSARLKAAADQHFRDGNARLLEGNVDAARREFLLSLAADPDHAEAFDALKNRLEPDATFYTVAAGDTFESIAKMKYGDPSWAPLVVRVNDLDPAGRPVPGTVLTLPNLSLAPAKPVKSAPGTATEAAETPDSGYDTEPATLGGDGAPPPVPAAPAASDETEADKKAKAEELYNAGVRYFINQKLDKAILSWERTLALNPDHPKAPRDIEKARGLLKMLKELR